VNKAFVKEEDHQADSLPDHLIPPQANLVTERGLSLIEAEIAQLEETRSAARLAGKSTAGFERDLRYWRERQASAHVVKPQDDDRVQFGSSVTLEREDGRRLTYRIVGIDEANPAQGTLSYVSPLAQAMMDNRRGDAVQVGSLNGRIVEIG
jgi:transcription elongation GreA/GreB family factor